MLSFTLAYRVDGVETYAITKHSFQTEELTEKDNERGAEKKALF